MNDQSKLIEKYRTWMMVWMALTIIGGIALAFIMSREYYSYSYFSGGYYETNWIKAISYLVGTGILAALEYAICNVTCECFNNVHIIRKALESNKQEQNATEEENTATENAHKESTVNNAATIEDKSEEDNHNAETNVAVEENSNQ